MTQAPRGRPWFQLHLSTCVVLMLVAGGMVGANLVPRIVKNGDKEFPIYRQYGWPWFVREELLDFGPIKNGERILIVAARGWYTGNLAKNILLGIAGLGIVAFSLEERIRRRADDEAEFRESIG